jgi:hypothetical protein
MPESRRRDLSPKMKECRRCGWNGCKTCRVTAPIPSERPRRGHLRKQGNALLRYSVGEAAQADNCQKRYKETNRGNVTREELEQMRSFVTHPKTDAKVVKVICSDGDILEGSIEFISDEDVWRRFPTSVKR